MNRLLLPVLSAIAGILALWAHSMGWVSTDVLTGVCLALPLPGLPELVRSLRSRQNLSPEEVAQIAYERYGDSVNWVAVSGAPMPRWPDLAARIQGAWVEAARGACGLPPGCAPGALAPPAAPQP